MKFIMKQKEYVYRVINDWNRKKIYSRRKVLGLGVCQLLFRIDSR